MSETNFDFNIGNGYMLYVNSNIILHLTCINNSVSCLYFTDENNKKIVIPDGITVYAFDFQNNNKVILNSIKNNNYALCYSDDYDVEFNGRHILNIKNKRTWNITKF